MGLRRLSLRTAFAAATALALVPSAEAQWLPFGAAPPREIVQRLRAEGYVLIGPLRRRDTIYLADVEGGPAGRERLVIDAWSGEILQRFVARRGGFAPEGGEFSEPPPLGPPPSRDFREGNYGHGPGSPGEFEPPKARPRSRPAATARKGGEPKPAAPAAQPAPPQNAAVPAQAAPPAAAAEPAAPPTAPANPNSSAPAEARPSPPNAAPEPAREAQPQPAAAPTAAAEAKRAASPPSPSPAKSSPASAKPSEKKVNDLPVNPLD